MTETYDVIVLGVGAMGAAACLACARRGARVLGIEQFDVPHDLGSSGGHTRLIRKAYFEHPDYVPLLQAAYRAWDEIGLLAGAPLLIRTGLLYLGPADGPLVGGSLRAAQTHGIPVEHVAVEDVRHSYPEFRVPEGCAALFEPDAGLVLAERSVAAMAGVALRHGAVIHGRERVRSWQELPGHVQVATERGEYQADRLIVTAGPWAVGLLRDLGVQLTVTRQVLAWTWPLRQEAFALGRFPCFAIEEPGKPGLFYGFPSMPDRPGVKSARHVPGPAVDPDALERVAQPPEEAAILASLEACLPGAAGPLVASKVCMYTMSPDGDFIVDRHPAHERVTLGCGFSGHGFKFAPVIGEALADLALTGASGLPIGFLGLARLRG